MRKNAGRTQRRPFFDVLDRRDVPSSMMYQGMAPASQSPPSDTSTTTPQDPGTSSPPETPTNGGAETNIKVVPPAGGGGTPIKP